MIKIAEKNAIFCPFFEAQNNSGLHGRQLATAAAGVVDLVAHNVIGGCAVVPWPWLRRVREGQPCRVDYPVITDQTDRHLKIL